MDELLQGIIACLLLGTALRIALRLIYGTRGPAPGDACYFVMLLMSRLLLVFSIGAGLIAFFGTTGIVMWIVTAVVAVHVWDQFVRRRQQTLLSVLATSIDAGLPLPQSLEALAAEQSGRAARKTERFAERLKLGLPLTEAIRRAPNMLPYTTPAYAALGDYLDALPETLRRNIADDHRHNQIWLTATSRLGYVAGLVLVMLSVVTFCMIKIVPAFEKIFSDFELDLPLVTQWLIQTSSDSTRVLSLLFVPIGSLVIWLLAYFAVRRFGWIRNIPLVSRWSRGQHRATVLGALAIAARHERRLLPVVRMLAAEFPIARVQKPLQRVAIDVEGGESIWESLRRHRLIGSSECAVLESAQRVGNLPWALEEMSSRAAAREALRLQAVIDTLFPLIVLGLGVLVAFFAIGLFMPLVKLVNELL